MILTRTALEACFTKKIGQNGRNAHYEISAAGFSSVQFFFSF